MKITYHDSFIPIPKNEIKTPEETSFFFCKTVINNDSSYIMEGYKIISPTSYSLNKVIYGSLGKWNQVATKISIIHNKRYHRIPFIIRYLEEQKETFVLREYNYDENGNYKGYHILSGQYIWFWEEEERFNTDGKQIEYIKYFMDMDLNIIKEQFYNHKGGKLLHEEFHEN